jgi:hypothetical protein
MKSLNHGARLQFPTDFAPTAVAMSSMVVCPACFVEGMASPQQSYMAAMYRLAFEAAQASVQREALNRRWSNPSMN